jgi:hypothetical protein
MKNAGDTDDTVGQNICFGIRLITYKTQIIKDILELMDIRPEKVSSKYLLVVLTDALHSTSCGAISDRPEEHRRLDPSVF